MDRAKDINVMSQLCHIKFGKLDFDFCRLHTTKAVKIQFIQLIIHSTKPEIQILQAFFLEKFCLFSNFRILPS